jgi:hypothetical protein
MLGLYQDDQYGYLSMTGNTFTNNIIYSAGSFQPSLWAFGGSGIQLPVDTTNLYYSAISASIPNVVVVDSAPKYANPQFTNPSIGDYSMPSSSPAYSQISWQTLATDQGPLPNPL